MKTHPFLWSVRRELWEHRSIFLGPLVVGVSVIVAVAFNVRTLQDKISMLAGLDDARQKLAIVAPFTMSAAVILVASFVVAAFYCFEALNNERRDRSILFWKSMPVSDATSVLSKAVIPLAVQPAVGMAVALVTQFILLILVVAALSVIGVDIAPLWAKLPVLPMTIAMLYGVVVNALWYAPGYALMLMLSAWVRRPMLWFAVPILAIPLLEKLAFGTNFGWTFIRWRLLGANSEAFAAGAGREPITSLDQLDPVRFLSSPGLWAGLVFAAGFIYAAIHLRRRREPL